MEIGKSLVSIPGPLSGSLQLVRLFSAGSGQNPGAFCLSERNASFSRASGGKALLDCAGKGGSCQPQAEKASL